MGVTPEDIVKPLRSDSKLAYTIKRIQVTTCKNNCLVESEHWIEECWFDEEDQKERCVKRCPLEFLEIH